MYNRYIPSADGTYQRKIVPSPQQQRPTREQPPESPQPKPAETPSQAKPPANTVLPLSLPRLQLDTGDILVLLILLLVLTEGEDSDPLSALITLGAFLLMQ